jgi:hypothetical protein
MKKAIIITSEPNNGEEALGRVFNALALASEAQANNGDRQFLWLALFLWIIPDGSV